MKKVFSIIYVFTLINFSGVFASDSVSLTTSGGVSLGVYEAGYLYYTIKFGNTINDDTVKILTGASAGALNSFLGILEGCSDSPEPSESLFWKTWIPLGIDQLYPPKEKRPKSVLTREGLEDMFTLLQNRWHKGLRKGCHAYLGVSLTRKESILPSNSSLIDYPRIMESTVVHITGRGEGIAPKVENVIVNPRSSQITLPLSKDDNKNFEILKSVLLASSSFPVAFKPTSIPHCISTPPHKEECNGKKVRYDEFVDGGVFNNGPLDLAYKIAGKLNISDRTTYYYFDPDYKNFPTDAISTSSEFEEGIIKEGMIFLKNFVQFSRSTKVSNFLNDHPELLSKVEIIKGNLPLASSPMEGFLGFFEKDFREFDFYIGMLDAKLEIERRFGGENVTVEQIEKMRFEWKLLECLNSVFSGDSRVMRYCREQREIKPNLRALYEYSLNRLYLACKTEKKDVTNRFCQNIRKEGELSKYFTELNRRDDFDRRSELHFLFHELNRKNFEFKDLGLKGSESHLGLITFNQKLREIISDSIENQPENHKSIIKRAAYPLLNYITYTPVFFSRYGLISSNTFELGVNLGFNADAIRSSLKLNFGLNLNGIDNLIYSDSKGLGVTPFVGLIGEPHFLDFSSYQIGLFYRTGYQLSSEVDFSTDRCGNDPFLRREFANCSFWLHQAGVSLNILDFINVRGLYQFSFASEFAESNRNEQFSLLFGLQY